MAKKKKAIKSRNVVKNKIDSRDIKRLLQNLTGQKIPFDKDTPIAAVRLFNNKIGLGFSQLNELLLYMGYDRVTSAFFQYIVDESTEYKHKSEISSFEAFEKSVDRFRKIAILIFGNVKYGFKILSQDQDELESWLERLKPINVEDYTGRHDPVLPIAPIPPEDTYYLGYIIEQELKDRLKKNPNDNEAKRKNKHRKSIVKKGEKNYEAYLLSDHLDVYVATSMRQPHEYVVINKLAKKIFEHKILKPLKLRWFDPTQAYCKDRIDKGLAEALMLKRAKCTIYLVQESDTLGKDSELASTLAQGKPVIAFIPKGDEKYVRELLSELKKINDGKTEADIIIDQLRIFDSAMAWQKAEARKWIDRPGEAKIENLRNKLDTVVKKQYDKRAKVLSERHPLGIQVHLSTGVANGVLVVRTIDACARLVKRILTKKMEFDLDQYSNDKGQYLVLREKISNCIFRVVTGDALLTNTFWNYYFEPSE